MGIVVFILLFLFPTFSYSGVKVAVEFNTHASSFYVAKRIGLLEKNHVQVSSYDSYVTGMALAASLRKGIDAAYMCLIPAILAYANGGIKIKVVCGTHLYGYGLVVNPRVISSLKDLERKGVKIGCPREGSPNDCLLHRLVEKRGLDEKRVFSNVVRMPPPTAFMALKTGRIHAAFLPEPFPSLAAHEGFRKLVDARELWVGMQGSVLVVKDGLIKKSPLQVEGLVKSTVEAISWIKRNIHEASKIVSDFLSVEGGRVFPMFFRKEVFSIPPSVVETSLTEGMVCTAFVDPEKVQEEIDYLYHLGYIKKPFDGRKMLFLKWCREKISR